MSATLRTRDIIKYTVRKITRADSPYDVDKHERKGFIGQSHLLYQENFHFIYGIPCEYMHLACLGVVKRLLEVTFDVPNKKEKLSKRKYSNTELFNIQIRKIQFMREFSRRCRNLDPAVIKAQEYRNIIIFFFPLVLNCIEDSFSSEKMVWLYLAYIIRSCVLPNQEFEDIDPNDIKSACKKFYSLFEKCYGSKNCTYSVHVLASHILRIRGSKPLTATSAFVYENFYSEMKNLFHPGSISTLKSIVQNTAMKRTLEPHSCSKPIQYNPQKVPNTGLENNSIIYVYDEQKTYKFYNIVKINPDNSFLCNQQGRFEYESQLTPELNWSLVGVFKLGPSTINTCTIQRNQVQGKVIKVDKFLITCPINVLKEQ